MNVDIDVAVSQMKEFSLTYLGTYVSVQKSDITVNHTTEII